MYFVLRGLQARKVRTYSGFSPEEVWVTNIIGASLLSLSCPLSFWFPHANTTVLFAVCLRHQDFWSRRLFWKLRCHLQMWICKVDRSFSQWKLPLSAKASFTSKTEIYIFWNYSHFYLLSKVNIHVLFNEYLLTLSPTLYCVCGQMN